MEKSLQLQIKAFGLNPKHWLIKLSPDKLVLAHKKDKGLILTGKLLGGSLTDLSLLAF